MSVNKRSTNQDIRELLKCLFKEADGSLTDEKIEEKVLAFHGNGKVALEYQLHQWRDLFGDELGTVAYQGIWQIKEQYVDGSCNTSIIAKS